jgi:dihydrofolate synthase/folylpolyglutamate synthase
MAAAYRELLERLFRARRFGVVLGIDRIAALLARLGSPHQRIDPRVVIAGTNGKGSTAAFLEAIATTAGRRVGVFSSPHLERFAERFRIDGAPASEDAIAAAAARVTATGGDGLTFFEQCSAIAAVLFADAGVDLGIFEVGLGGRLDATRALECELAVITGVSYDHCDVLGDSLETIAGEKAGIIAPGGRAVIGLGGEPESPSLLLAAAGAAGAARIRRVEARDREALPAVIGLAGAHQRDNAAAAAVAAELLGLPAAAIAPGLAAARLPGRFEIIARDPEIILDGAHNPDGARALAAALAARPAAATAGVFAALAGRDPAAILGPLRPRLARVIAAPIATVRSADPADLGADEIAPSIEEALARARASFERVVVFGSLYGVGEARRLFSGAPLDAVELSDPSTASGGGRTPAGTDRR